MSNYQPLKETILAEGGNVIELYERCYADWSDLVIFKKAASPEQPAEGDRSTSKP